MGGIQCLYGQTCCTAGAPISNFLEVDGRGDKSLTVHTLYEYKSINWLVDQNQRLTNDPRSRSGQNLGVKLDYSINQKWAISTILPMVYQRRTTLSSAESSLGVGDLTVLAQYQPIIQNLIKVSVTAGVKLPTGITHHRSASGILLSPDMQSGTGSVDYLLRSAITIDQVLLPLLSASLSGVYRFNGENANFGATDTFDGRRFQFGNVATFIGGLRYLFVREIGFLIPDLNLKIRTAGHNTEQSSPSPNSGGRWWSMPFGLTYQPSQSLSIRAYGEIPISQRLQGLQITTNYTIGIQLGYLL